MCSINIISHEHHITSTWTALSNKIIRGLHRYKRPLCCTDEVQQLVWARISYHQCWTSLQTLHGKKEALILVSQQNVWCVQE